MEREMNGHDWCLVFSNEGTVLVHHGRKGASGLNRHLWLGGVDPDPGYKWLKQASFKGGPGSTLHMSRGAQSRDAAAPRRNEPADEVVHTSE